MSGDLSGLSMQDLFRLEAESQTAVLAAGVMALEGVERAPDTFEALMRAAHSLKGAARIVNLEPAVRVAHALEDVFVAAGRGTLRVRPEHADVLLAAIDFLAAIARAGDALAAGGPWPARADALVTELGRLAADAPPVPQAAASTTAGPVPAPETDVASVPADVSAEPPVGTRSGRREAADRVVRVSADSLTRLVGLAGESLVEARQLRPFVAALGQLRGTGMDLCERLASLEERIGAAGIDVPAPLAALLAGARQRADACLARLADLAEDFDGFSRRNEDLSNRLHHEVLVSRMRPLADGIRGFPRLVRDLARTLGKQVRLDVRGEQTGVDRDILDKLEAPLSHLVRNAVDHGLETPAERRAAGKDPTGSIRLEARHRAGMLQISITDDGRGIDVPALRDRAVARGLVAAGVAGQLAEHEVLEFLFLPGFSTKDGVT